MKKLKIIVSSTTVTPKEKINSSREILEQQDVKYYSTEHGGMVFIDFLPKQDLSHVDFNLFDGDRLVVNNSTVSNIQMDDYSKDFIIEHTVVGNVTLSGLNITYLNSVSFNGVEFENCKFYDCILYGTVFRDCSFKDCQFEKVDFQDGSVFDTTFDERCTFKKFKLNKDVDTVNTNLRDFIKQKKRSTNLLDLLEESEEAFGDQCAEYLDNILDDHGYFSEPATQGNLGEVIWWPRDEDANMPAYIMDYGAVEDQMVDIAE